VALKGGVVVGCTVRANLICEDAHNLQRKVGVMCLSETSGFEIGQQKPGGCVKAVTAIRTPTSRGSKSRAENGLRNRGRVWCRRTIYRAVDDGRSARTELVHHLLVLESHGPEQCTRLQREVAG
jgi:hypothetical protein